MREADDDELRELRRRAYGPDADIHTDHSALDRLRELEGAGSERPAHIDVDANHEAPASPLPARDEVPVDAEPPDAPASDASVEGESPARSALRRLARLTRAAARRVSRLRRSTVLIMLGLAVVAALISTALVLVQRVQVDPLQSGAKQVARLSIDPAYEAPAFFQYGIDSSTVLGFAEFHGLRALVTPGGVFGHGSDSDCLVLYSSADLEGSDSTSFSGLLVGGCAAGGFPPMTQFLVDAQGLPAELTTAFPTATALQFVYDSANQEIVVFASQ
jgi:hypothetical protein